MLVWSGKWLPTDIASYHAGKHSTQKGSVWPGMAVTKQCLVLAICKWSKSENNRLCTCRKQHKLLLCCKRSYLNNAAWLGSGFVLWTLMDSNNSKLTENEPPSIYQYFDCILQLGMIYRVYLKQPALMQTRRTPYWSQQDLNYIRALTRLRVLLLLGWETATTRWHLMLPFSHTVRRTRLCMVVVFHTRQIR